ncbi:hypothetical protein GCM10009760_18870 [Kitasatospora kazusensis]|uniref:Uncharacterized protein n=1 Tax=Kitasatospora kazusensis TaxID=407974 RepID=A0ABN2Z7C8_9ACTN
MSKIEMIKLLDFYREHGYPMNGAAYQRITNRVASGEYPVYAPSPKVRYITPETAEKILKEVPPPTSDKEVEEDMDTVGHGQPSTQQPDEDGAASSELRALRAEVAQLRLAIIGLTETLKNHA